jgi:hypothetical protein
MQPNCTVLPTSLDTRIDGEMAATLAANAPQHIYDCRAATSDPGGVYEDRVPKPKHHGGTVSGYYSNLIDATKVGRLYANPQNVIGEARYTTLNPVAPELLARSVNRDRRYARETTIDADITWRRHFLLDIDPKRRSGISATDEEHALAQAMTRGVIADLDKTYDMEPVLAGTSGNGGFAWYRIDLPNDADATRLIKQVLAALAQMFDEPLCQIDTSVYNAARIAKIPGTIAAKGDHMVGQDQPDRPWRFSWATTINPEAPITTVDQLRAIMAEVEDD